VHELRVINSEGEALTETALRDDSGSDFNEYMNLKFDSDESVS
jgi:hypothetical protein